VKNHFCQKEKGSRGSFRGNACSIGDKSGERDGRSSKIIWTVQKTPYLLPYENEHRLVEK
jgi:hypothetical protein